MPTPSEETPSWEKEFDEKFADVVWLSEMGTGGAMAASYIKAFIATVRQEGYAEGRKAALADIQPKVLKAVRNVERYFTLDADRRGETDLSKGMRAAIKKLGDDLAALSTGNEGDNGDRLAEQANDAIDKRMLECFRGNEEGEKEV